MIQLSNSTAQNLAPGQALVFDTIIAKSCRCRSECFSLQLPTSVKLTGGCGSVYDVEFSGNIAATDTAGQLQLSIALQGQSIPVTQMNSYPAAVGQFNNVSNGTYVVLSCSDLDRVSIINTSTTTITVAANANLRIRRES